MGMRYCLRLYKGVAAASMRSQMEQAAKALSGFIVWNQPGEGPKDLRLASNGPVHSLYLPYQGIDFDFCRELGRRLDVPWIELRIQEGALWDYALYRAGDCLDTFSVCPQFWEGEDTTADSSRQWQGKPHLLAENWRMPVERIVNYLVNWGYREDPVEGVFEYTLKGKAYPDDEFEYGQFEQFYDILRALGGEEPLERHQILLPEDRQT